MVKVLTVPGKDKILGTIHIYPTLTEANKYAAGNWIKAHAPLVVITVGGTVSQVDARVTTSF
jgi:hypothetical protein